MSNPMRNVILTRQSTGPDGTFGEWVSDSGFSCKTIEKQWANDKTDISCVRPGPGDPPVKYLVLWQLSPEHKCNLYHLQDQTRDAIEIHSANLQMQLKGCLAPGISFGMFQKDSIATAIPPQATQGVILSVETLAKLEKDLRDDNGNQMPFYLTIKWA